MRRQWTKKEKMELLKLTKTKENGKYLSIQQIMAKLKEKFGNKYREYTEPSISNFRNARLFPWARETIKEYEEEIDHYLEIIREMKENINILRDAKEIEKVRLRHGNSRKYT